MPGLLGVDMGRGRRRNPAGPVGVAVWYGRSGRGAAEAGGCQTHMDAAALGGARGAKLAPPRIQAIARDRLGTMLDRVWQARLGLVVGPAGSGKSTLLSQFAARVNVPYIWYRADVHDGSGPALLASLGRGAATSFSGLGRNWKGVEDLVHAFEDWDGGSRSLLIVDDLHYL